MRHVSLYDLPDGNDRAELLHDLSDSFGLRRVQTQFLGRGDSSDPETAEQGILLLVAQGACVVRVEGVTCPACRFDLLAIERGETFEVIADEIDPAVVLRIDLNPR